MELWEKLYIIGKIQDDIIFSEEDLKNEKDEENINNLNNRIEDLIKLIKKVKKL